MSSLLLCKFHSFHPSLSFYTLSNSFHCRFFYYHFLPLLDRILLYAALIIKNNFILVILHEKKFCFTLRIISTCNCAAKIKKYRQLIQIYMRKIFSLLYRSKVLGSRKQVLLLYSLYFHRNLPHKKP